MTLSVAIAVVSWNTRELLDACLASMWPDADAGLADVWVVDNGSTDGSREMVRERHPWARLLVPERNLGYGPAVNRVAAETTTPWVVASNADIVLRPGALAALLAAGRDDPSVGVVGPRLILPDGSTQPGVQPFPGVSDALLRNTSAYKLSRGIGERLCLQGYWDPDRPAAVDWVTGAFMVIRREAYEQIGGFDEEQWMYAEDLDICWRAHEAGWGVRYEPRAGVHHVLSVATEKAFGDSERRARRMIREDYAWMARRRGLGWAWAVGLTEMATLAARRAALLAAARVRPDDRSQKVRQVTRTLHRHREGLRALAGQHR